MRFCILILCLCLLRCADAPQPSPIPTIDTSILAIEAANALKLALSDLEKDPSAKNWEQLGLYCQAHGLDQEAISAYEVARSLPNTNTKTNYWLALSLAKLGQYEAAIKVCESYDRYTPAFWRRGYWSIDLGKIDMAKSLFEQTLEIDSSAAPALVGLARTYLQQGNAQEAVGILEKIKDRGGQHPYLSYLLGTAYQRLGRTEEAESLLIGSVTVPPKWPDPWYEEMRTYKRGYAAMFERAIGLLDNGKIQEALFAFQKLKKQYPRDPAVLSNYASIQMQLGKLTEATKTCGDSIRWNPTHAHSELTMALALLQLGELQLAKSHIDRAIALQPGHARSYSVAGKIAVQNKNLSEAAKQFEQALSIGSNDPLDREMLAMICLELRQFEKAVVQFEHVLKVSPHATRSLGGLIVALANLRKFQEAEHLLIQALKQFPSDQHLQRAYAVLERLKKP
ncbi:MAG: tetratricopeptide repeat protein [Phycisphaerales bacterium]|nr:tetratricopeptide repeat protein [Phycisphaerales bacterium]